MRKKEKIRIKRIMTVCICSLVVLAVNGCGKERDDVKQEESDLPQIIVGSDNYPPFNYTDTDGEATGIDVDLATEAFRRMGYQAKFITIDWEEKRELLQTGKVDCVWGCFSMDGREDEYKWAGPYMVSRQVAAVSPESEINSLQDLQGKTIAVQSTTKPEELFRNREKYQLPEIREVISVQNRELIYYFLSKGYVDAIAAHETAILQYMSDYGLKFRILEEPLLTAQLGVAFDKEDDRGFAEELTEIFKEMQKDGTEKKIIGKYLDDPEKYMEVEHEK